MPSAHDDQGLRGVRQRTIGTARRGRVSASIACCALVAALACAPASPSTRPQPSGPSADSARAAIRDSAARDSVARASAARDSVARADAAREARRAADRREADRREAARRDAARVATERAAREAAARDSARRALARRRVAGAAARPRAPGDVRLCAGGDVSLGTNIDTSWTALAAKRLKHPVPALVDPDSLLFALRPLVADADIVLLNVEGAVGDGPAPRKCGPRSTGCFALRQPPAVAGALRRFGGDAIVVGNVANNHARDAGLPGFAETQRRLDDAGVLITGADTMATVVVTPAGDTIAFLGFSSSAVPDVRDTAAVRRHVARAVAAWGRVVVTAHLGAEGAGAQRTRNADERYFGAGRGNPVAFARAALDAGAAMVIGHGPHVMRAIEWRDGRLVAYSLGNLATYGPFVLRDPLDRGAILCASLGTDGRAADVVVQSTRQERPGVPAPDPAARAARLIDQLGRADFPRTGARVNAAGQVRPPR